jgi:uncharacterized protein
MEPQVRCGQTLSLKKWTTGLRGPYLSGLFSPADAYLALAAFSSRTVILFKLMFSIKFSDAAAALTSANTAVAIAEAHGCLCGALCVSHDYSFAHWLDELLDDQVKVAATEAVAAKDLLQSLYAGTLSALRGDEMEFAPFLPDDDAPLAERAEALAQWCHGFLYGFGSTSGVQRKLSTEVDEVLRDLTQIARATAGETEPTEEDEADYIEIVEYVRAGVQLVHDELRPTLQ